MPSLLNTVRDLERLRQIVGVLAVHGFGEVVTRTGLGSLLTTKKKISDRAPMPVAIRIRKVLEGLGPSFVKLGQIVHTDFLAELLTDVDADDRNLRFAGEVQDFGATHSQVTVSGGSVSLLGVGHQSQATIAGGAVGVLALGAGGGVNITGGSAGDIISAFPDSRVNLYGTAFSIDGSPIRPT